MAAAAKVLYISPRDCTFPKRDEQVSIQLILEDGKLVGDQSVISLGSLDVVYALNGSVEKIDALLGEINSYLRPSGKLIVREAVVENAKENSTLRTKNEVLMSLMIGGFLDSQVVSLPSESEDTLYIEVSCSKPAFDLESKAKVTLPKKEKTSTTSWNIRMDDDDDLIDEDSLLDDNITGNTKATDDCEVGPGGKRRACKNCVCGRKDMDEKPVITDEELAKSVSSCGNCYKGDAFRCGSCPFLGKPAFKPGMETVLLDLDSE